MRSRQQAQLAALTRRFVVLSALRWFPTGLLIPLTAVLMQSRGLSLAEIGLVAATQGVVVVLLELPTGGLADALGRRPVLLAASAFDVAAVALLLVAHSPAGFLVAAVVQGAFRALESGPLEAWYVDASLAVDVGADIERGLARATTALGFAIAGGALATAGLVAFAPLGDADALAVPVAIALGLRFVDMAGIARFVIETRRSIGLAGARASVVVAPKVVRSTVRLVASSPALLALVAIELLWGAGMVGVELFSGPRLVDLLGDPEQGVAVFGVAAALGWVVCAAGSALTGRLTSRPGREPARAGAVLRVAQGAAVGVMAVLGGPLGLVTGYLGFYLVHGAANVVHHGMVHRLVDADHRTTVLSAHSLASRLGGAASAVGLGVLATATSIPLALALAAVLLAAAAPLYRVAGRGRPLVPVAGGSQPSVA
ncbi:MAG: MFS transporter [Acidimicrobiales bacterium]